MSRNFVQRKIGWPDEMQARLMIIDACKRVGGRAAFCRQIGLSRRYFNLIMEWKRSPAHPKILSHFEWGAVYMTPEDLLELTPRRGRPRSQVPEHTEGQRAYWRQKQAESRLRRRTALPPPPIEGEK